VTRIVLRPFERGDLAAFVAYRREPAVAAYQSWDTGFSDADAARFLAEQEGLELITPGRWVQRAIADAQDGQLLGDVAVHALAATPRTAEVGITLAPAAQGRGLAAEAVRTLLAALFDQYGMHRVVAHADDRNVPVQRLLEGVGFRCEARHGDADWFKDEWSTLRTYALLAGEWWTR
jgi:RimJ/RimL family protein N-acetyltransferase